MNNELVSVIVPTYNRGYIIGTALESLRKQDYRNFEVIIVDDGSEDETANIAEAFSDLDITYIKLEKNQGACHARNIGIEYAKGEYIAFLDSDNEYLPNNLAVKMDLLCNASENAGLIFSSFFRVRNKQKEIFPAVEQNKDIEKNLKKSLLRFNFIDTSTVIVKKKCLKKVGLFDENFPRLQDWDMFSRVLFVGGYEALFCEKPLCINKIQKDSLSTNPDKYFEAKTLFYRKRLQDYKRYYTVEQIIDLYAFKDNTLQEISLYRRMAALLTLGFTEVEWDEAWKYKINQNKRNNKNLAVYNKWVQAEEKGYRISGWLKKNNFRTIAVYGYGYLGKHLVHELLEDNVEIAYIFDKNRNAEHGGLKVYHDLDNMEKADVIIVTAVYYYQQIRKELETRTLATIVSLLDILDAT